MSLKLGARGTNVNIYCYGKSIKKYVQNNNGNPSVLI